MQILFCVATVTQKKKKMGSIPPSPLPLPPQTLRQKLLGIEMARQRTWAEAELRYHDVRNCTSDCSEYCERTMRRYAELEIQRLAVEKEIKDEEAMKQTILRSME